MIKTCNCILWKRCARWTYFYTTVARGRESHTRTNWKGNARHLCDFYWRMINLQKSLVDSISNFCSAQQWSCSSFAFMCIVSPSISWGGVTTRLQRMEHRSLVLFNHRHQKGSHLIPCKGFVDQNKQEAGGNVFSGGYNSLQRSLFLLTKQFFLEPTKPISLFIRFYCSFLAIIAYYIQLSNWHHYRQLIF